MHRTSHRTLFADPLDDRTGRDCSERSTGTMERLEATARAGARGAVGVRRADPTRLESNATGHEMVCIIVRKMDLTNMLSKCKLIQEKQ
eukprot:8999927-Pyramimonas_sp.AAC.1